MLEDREATIRYIRERRCEDGGYCFYLIDDPNPLDTFCALHSLWLLKEPVTDDDETVQYLQGLQRSDGRYADMVTGSAVIRSLLLLHERPERDTSAWILGTFPRPRKKRRQTETLPGFEDLMLAVECSNQLDIEIPKAVRENLISEILRRQ